MIIVRKTYKCTFQNIKYISIYFKQDHLSKSIKVQSLRQLLHGTLWSSCAQHWGTGGPYRLCRARLTSRCAPSCCSACRSGRWCRWGMEKGQVKPHKIIWGVATSALPPLGFHGAMVEMDQHVTLVNSLHVGIVFWWQWGSPLLLLLLLGLTVVPVDWGHGIHSHVMPNQYTMKICNK